MFKIASDERG